MSSAIAPPASSGYAGLYRGTMGTKGFGEELRRMATSGRQIAREERQRWLENRAFYRGEQWVAVNPGSGSIRLLARDMHLRSGRRRDTANRLRAFVDGRVALYASEKPPFEIVPPDNDQASLDGAKQAERFIDAHWGENGWGIKATIPELARAGEIDGLAFLYVNWNRTKGSSGNLPLPFTADGRPITDRAALEALRQADPEGGLLWSYRTSPGPLGDVEWRIVRAGALSIDPYATNDFRDARWIVESRVLPREEIERIARRPIKAILDDSDTALGEYGNDQSDMPDVSVDDGDGRRQTMRGRDALVVHEAFRRPGGDWPRGAHCIWLDRAPGAPVMAEPWDDDLPYRPFMPKPDGGHFLRSRGTVDDLKPIQRRFNRVLSLLHEWLDRVGRPPFMFAKGSLASSDVYNEGGYFEYYPGFEKPDYFRAPSEPANVLTTHLQWMEQQMAEIANQTNVVRGQAPGQGVESNVALMSLAQATEQQLSGSASELVRIYEWGVSRALKLVGRHYIVPRMIAAPGVSDSEEFAAFTGQMLHGASRFKVNGSILPKSRAAEVQGLMQFSALLGPELKPYLPQLIAGRTEEWKSSIDEQRQRQKRRQRAIAALAADEKARTVFDNFEAGKQMFAEALQLGAQSQALQPTQVPGMPLSIAVPAPMDAMRAAGITPPRLTDQLQLAGVAMPEPFDEQDDPFQQEPVLRQWMVSEGFEKLPPLVRQVARELLHDMQARVARQLGAMAAQEPPAVGSEAVEKGTPSPPRQPGQPGGQPAATLPSGG